MKEGWRNVTRGRPCPVCGKPDWCTVSDDGCVCVCRRIASPYPAKSGMGWIHRLKEGARPVLQAAAPAPPCPALDFTRIHGALEADPAVLDGLSLELDVAPEALRALDVRWDPFVGAAAFPMRDAAGRVTGIRYRALMTGEKWSARGSRDGLFAAHPFRWTAEGARRRELYVCEGASDTAAALSLGLDAVGRSCCLAGADALGAFCRAQGVRRVTVIADRDRPGQAGAAALAARLGVVCTILTPPAPHKDLRAWYGGGTLTKDEFRRREKKFSSR